MVQQTQAMRTKLFEVGLFKPGAAAEMLLRTWDSETLVESIAWLKFQNVDGRNIYIRPKGEHTLSMVDDLTADALERMKHSPPGHFQRLRKHFSTSTICRPVGEHGTRMPGLCLKILGRRGPVRTTIQAYPPSRPHKLT
jgi:hypothetical protein